MTKILEVGAKIRCKNDYSIATTVGNVYTIEKVVGDGAGGCIYHYQDDDRNANDMETIGHDYLRNIFEVVTDTVDNVNSPQHYTRGDLETIDVIEHIVAGYADPFVSYCVGNAVKYEDRAPFKHGSPAEDLRKAAWYLSRAADHLDGKGAN